MSLLPRQHLFLVMLGSLIDFAHRLDYQLQGGDLWRSTDLLKCPACGVSNTYQNILVYNGRSADPHSKHLDRLAVDLIVSNANPPETAPHYYKVLGEYWESLGGTWGGRWKLQDLGHFELAPESLI